MFDNHTSMMIIWKISRFMGVPPVTISNVIRVIDMLVNCPFPRILRSLHPLDFRGRGTLNTYCSVDIYDTQQYNTLNGSLYY